MLDTTRTQSKDRTILMESVTSSIVTKYCWILTLHRYIFHPTFGVAPQSDADRTPAERLLACSVTALHLSIGATILDPRTPRGFSLRVLPGCALIHVCACLDRKSHPR